MKLSKLSVLCVAFGALCLTACGGNNGGSEQEPDNTVSVFVLSGQSNMEGNSSSTDANLKQAFQDLELEDYNDLSAITNGLKLIIPTTSDEKL